MPERSRRHGHPSTLHLWWARRPLAACRAVLFASLVDDPSALPEQFPTLEAQEAERQRLFRIIEAMVKWENVNNEDVMDAARAEIMRSTNGNPPPVLDPFCGGGSIPLEAQRLGLEAHASDLNPVAVLITKALIEIPPKFAGQPPVHPGDKMARTWKGAQGLAEDVRYYGNWMRDEAFKRIGHLYPKVQLPKEHGGGEATVIAWIWARTVLCPNPACGARMPLVRSFALSTRTGQETWVEPVIDHVSKTVSFTVKSGLGTPPEPPKLGRGANFRCLVCGGAAAEQHIKTEAMAGRMGSQMMAIVAEGKGRRVYLPPYESHEAVPASARPVRSPDAKMPDNPRWFSPPAFGMTTFGELFTSRQLVALTTFSDLIGEAREQLLRGAVAGLQDNGMGLDAGGMGAAAYADAVATYLALVTDRSADRGSTICTWDSSPKMEALRNTFARQAIPMTWDFAEGNPFSESSGNWMNNVEWVAMALSQVSAIAAATANQIDAASKSKVPRLRAFSTDPPYYDNIGYADLSDFFYIWLRRSLQPIYPSLFETMLVPKTQELIATPYRFGGSKAKAEAFFEAGLGKAFATMNAAQHPDYPLTVYYAFRQAESDDGDSVSGNGAATVSTGWETMLEGLLSAGFAITGTWPMRSELEPVMDLS
jgi:putative DNA methylase